MIHYFRTYLKINGVARAISFKRDDVAENETYQDMANLSYKSQPEEIGRSSQATK